MTIVGVADAVSNKICFVEFIPQASLDPSAPAGGVAFSHDARGATTEDGHFTYAYDAFGRIVTVTDHAYDPQALTHPTPLKARHAYDAAGRRVAVLYSGHDGDGLAADPWPDEVIAYTGAAPIEVRRYGESGANLMRRTFYEGPINKPALIEIDTNADGDVDDGVDHALIPLTDDRGTVLGLVTGKTDTVPIPGTIMLYNAGQIVERLHYNSTGLVHAHDGSGAAYATDPHRSHYVNLGWCGMIRSPFTGLYHTHFRDYSALHGRWLSEDPAGYKDGLNLYANYAGVNGVDVLGLGKWDISLAEVNGGQNPYANAAEASRKIDNADVSVRNAIVHAKTAPGAFGSEVVTQASQMHDAAVDEAALLISQGPIQYRESLIDKTADDYFRRTMLHYTVNGGDIEAACESGASLRMGFADAIGLSDTAMLWDAVVGGPSYNLNTGREVSGEEQLTTGFSGLSRFTGTVALIGGTGYSLGAGYTGTGFAGFEEWATSFKWTNKGEAYSLFGSQPAPSSVVKAGPTGLADDLLRYSGNVTPKAGFTDVFVHADAQAFHVLHNGKWIQLTHRDIARFLSSKGVTGNLRLISCNAAEGQLAQDLANKLGVTVEAATSKVLVPKNFTSAPLLEPGGRWNVFTPGEQ